MGFKDFMGFKNLEFFQIGVMNYMFFQSLTFLDFLQFSHSAIFLKIQIRILLTNIWICISWFLNFGFVIELI